MDSVTGTLSFGGQDPVIVPSGYFQCSAYNKYGTAWSNITQLIYIRLDGAVSTSNYPYSATVGNHLKIPCLTTGLTIVPGASYQWQLVQDRQTSDIKALQTDQRVQWDANGIFVILKLVLKLFLVILYSKYL